MLAEEFLEKLRAGWLILSQVSSTLPQVVMKTEHREHAAFATRTSRTTEVAAGEAREDFPQSESGRVARLVFGQSPLRDWKDAVNRRFFWV